MIASVKMDIMKMEVINVQNVTINVKLAVVRMNV